MHILTLEKLSRLLRRAHHVLIVCQDRDGVRVHAPEGMQKFLRGGIHGRSAVDDDIAAKIREHLAEAFSVRDRDHGKRLFLRVQDPALFGNAAKSIILRGVFLPFMKA